MVESSSDDSTRFVDMGTIVPAPAGQEYNPEVEWARFLGPYIESGDPAVVPVKVDDLREAGIDPDDPDPVFGTVSFWAEVDLDAGVPEKLLPANFKPIPHAAQEDVDAFDHPEV